MKKGLGKSFRNLFIALIVILYLIPFEKIQELYRMYFRTPFTTRKLEFLLRSRPMDLVLAMVFVICALVALVAFLRILFSFGKRGSTREVSGTYTTPKIRRAMAPKEEEEALHCEHKRGSEKYMEQIEGYLRTGLIDRDEYRVLKERYSRLNIPDDYH